jgi:hypothetical protein
MQIDPPADDNQTPAEIVLLSKARSPAVRVPKTAGGRSVRDAFARLPLIRAIGAVQRLAPAKGAGALPE